MDAYLAVVGKREVRRYRPLPVPRETLIQIVEAGRASGSSRNRQPWRFILITERARLGALSPLVSRPRNLEGCPAAIVVALTNPRMLFDAGRAAQNLMLAAWAMGVGSCPNTPLQEPTIKELLGLPADTSVPTILSLGYPAPGEPRPRPSADAAAVLSRVNRLALEEVLHRETYRS
jgi:nitroreductase